MKIHLGKLGHWLLFGTLVLAISSKTNAQQPDIPDWQSGEYARSPYSVAPPQAVMPNTISSGPANNDGFEVTPEAYPVTAEAWQEPPFSPEPTVDLERRVAGLEKLLQQRDAADRRAAEVASKQFTVRPFGRFHIHAASFNQDAANQAIVGDINNGIDFRRTRLGLEGEGFEIYFYRFDVDFTSFDQSTGTRPVIIDAYVDTQHLPVIGNLRVGHFREPFSLDRLESTHDLPFLERSAPINSLAPFRNMGIMAFDWNESESLTWACGLFDENTNELGENNDDRTGIAGTGRVTWLPWYDEMSGGRHLLHFGASYSYRSVADRVRRFNQTPEITLNEGAVRTPNFVDTGLLGLGEYHIAGVETSTVLGSLSIQGEYIFAVGAQTNSQDMFLQGAYVEAMYWLTGENRNYNRKQGIYGAVTPHSNFFRIGTDEGIQTGSGAWEATARLSHLDLNSNNVAGGELTNLTIGLNWYYAVRSRVMFNYIHSFLERGNVDSNADIVAMRFQIGF